MTDRVRISLQPLEQTFETSRGTSLRDALFGYGVEFPCGGRGQCKGCRIKLIRGNLSVNQAQREMLSAEEIEEGWRLSCQCRAEEDLEIELAQWKTDVLTDESLFEFVPKEGFGVAVDLGTTTLVAQLLNFRTGRVAAVKTALNRQALHGSDIMSRISFAMQENGQEVLRSIIREQIGKLIRGLLDSASSESAEPGESTPWVRGVSEVVIVGNTAMHHLFCGVDVTPLSAYPFEPKDDGMKVFSADDLGWDLEGNPRVRFLPCLGGFVGSDLLAGVLAVRMHRSDQVVALVDLGTNGEIILGNRDRMVCASTAAGPAFEGARISSGMRAATGAIYRVEPGNGEFRCRVLGDAHPRGICGSGLVDAVASGLELGLILPRGRFANKEDEITLIPPVVLTQTDIRQLQLAKGAIAAGFQILFRNLEVGPEELDRLFLAGAFGNYVDRGSARRIGLLNFPVEKIQPVGNSALLGAKIALFGGESEETLFRDIRARMEHLSLSSDPEFQEIYAGEMLFPG